MFTVIAFPASLDERNTSIALDHSATIDDQALRILSLSSTTLFGQDAIFWSKNITGAGSTIAVLDTGINANHTVFQNKTVYWKDVTNESYATPYDISGHGTMCASIAAGNSTGYQGIAPGCNIAAIKMFYEDSTGQPNAGNTQAIAAVNYLLANATAWNVTVASLSWGDDNMSANGQDQLSQAVDRLPEAGITTVVAQGNYEGNVTHVCAPGVSPDVITVGALDPTTMSVASFSLPGPTANGRVKPDLIAPGVDVAGADSLSNTSYASGSGTSFATPMVAGLAALILQEFPSLNPFTLKQLLCLTALQVTFTAGQPDNHQGWGLVNPAGVVQAMTQAWAMASPLHVSIAMNQPWNRSYVTKVFLQPGITNRFDITPPGDVIVGNTNLGAMFDVYLYSPNATSAGLPLLLASSVDGRLLVTVPAAGMYYLALKPRPGAWSAEGGDLTFSVTIVHSTSYEMHGAFIGGVSVAVAGACLSLGTVVSFTRNSRRKAMQEEFF
jgi:subtilisin family serine protease